MHEWSQNFASGVFAQTYAGGVVHGMSERKTLRRNEPAVASECIFLDCGGGSPLIEDNRAVIAALE
jgi:hypothetical protein